MGFSLQQVKRTRSDLPPRTIIYGPHKIGKSSFAAAAPSPIFIQTEDGLEAIDTNAFPLCHSWGDLLSAVASLYQEEHDFKTLVLDSVDWAQRLAQAQVCENQGVKGIEDIGYGKGYVYAADLFNELIDGLNAIRKDRRMHIVLLCHAEIKTFNDPTSDSYDRYQMKLHKQINKILQEWADVIGFAQIDAATKVEKKDDFKKTERTRAVTTGRRIVHFAPSAAFEAGNRYGLPNQIELSWDAYQTALNNSRACREEVEF